MGKIRTVKTGDLKELLSLLYQLSHQQGKKNKKRLELILEEIIENSNHCLVVFESKNKLIGTGTLLIEKNLTHEGRPKAHIENIVVDKKHRGKGIGQRIINHLIKKANEKDCYKVVLNCDKEKSGFYQKSGFKINGLNMRLDL